LSSTGRRVKRQCNRIARVSAQMNEACILTKANDLTKSKKSVPKKVKKKRDRLPKDLVLLQLALMLLNEQELTYERLINDFLLERRTAERYMADLRSVGLPIKSERRGREAVFLLDKTRNKSLRIEAVDIPPSAAQSLSLLLVAAALLPAHLGVREAV